MSVEEIIKRIKQSKLDTVVFTGGEPMMYSEEIDKIIIKLRGYYLFHVETNGDILPYNCFDYICFSPKDLRTTINVDRYIQFLSEEQYDIKVVTDGENMNKDLIPYATMLMPLTTPDENENLKIEQTVWEMCVKNNVRFCLRQHIHVWGEMSNGK